MATKKALLVFTRYYKGEDKNPFEIGTTEDTLWFYEKIWVESMGSDRGEFIEFLQNVWPKIDHDSGIPIGLISLLYSRYAHNAYDAYGDETINGFKKMFFEYYQKGVE